MNVKPWREVATPHPDVLEGTFQQSEFAADLTAVKAGRATHEYQDAKAFFQRTFITEGMRHLLTSVAQRLSGQGGDPIIQLQTAFGGGKTHTLLAVHHLATREGSAFALPGLGELLQQSQMKEVAPARVVILDGNALAPGQPWLREGQSVHTLWGEMAWQLGGAPAFALVRDADSNGTSPGKEVLQKLLEQHAPCIILIDELVAYFRQFNEGAALSGGTYDSNLSFIQALTEAVKQVPTAMVLASLPESEVEAGSQRGVLALKALEKTFGRVQALWKPVATEEAFEIVRRRLFAGIHDEAARAETCEAFASLYQQEGQKLPSETHEARYRARLHQAYPIHPEVFDRLYEDWTTLEGFQRTRGVLKLMAKVIYRLWKDDNRDPLIMPANMPLHATPIRSELTYYLPPGWDPVIDRDIDGERAETTELESREPRFGAIHAPRRVARTLFLGTAPASSGKVQVRGLERSRVLLGCLMPGQSASIYADTLSRLSDRLHYLSHSGDKSQESARYWFDTRANLRREMEERKARFDETNEVRPKCVEVLRQLTRNSSAFDGVHIFSPHSDLPDDSSLRLVILSPNQYYSKQEPRLAFDAVFDYLRQHGSQPRQRANRLLFLAAEQSAVSRFNDAMRTALAWKSILDDYQNTRLVLDNLQHNQAKRDASTADEVVLRVARECFKWMLCPSLATPADSKPQIEVMPLNSAAPSLLGEADRVCKENEWVIDVWAPVHLRKALQDWYWKTDKPSVRAQQVWEDTLRYLYLPRFRGKWVLEQSITQGAASDDFFGTAYTERAGVFEGFQLGNPNIQFDDSLLLIEPQTARQYQAKIHSEKAESIARGAGGQSIPGAGFQPVNPQPGANTPGIMSVPGGGISGSITAPPQSEGSKLTPKRIVATVEISAQSFKQKTIDLDDDWIKHLMKDPYGKVRISVEIEAELPGGLTEDQRRTLSENAVALGVKVHAWG